MKKKFLPYDLDVKFVELEFNEKTFDAHSDIVINRVNVVKKTNIENFIDSIKSEILQCKSDMEDNILTIGNLLLKVKSALGHGYFGEWLENEVEFSATSAKRFMRIAKEFSNSPNLINLGKSKLFALLDVENNNRESSINSTYEIDGKEKTIQEMSVRELNQIIKKYKDFNKKSRKPISTIIIKHITLRSQGKCEICGSVS